MKPIVSIIIAMILFCDLTFAQDTLYFNKAGSVLWKQAVTDIDSVTFHKVYTAPPQGTVTDIDGNIYHTVTIGKQIWMVENLKTTKYRNGDPIPNITDNSAWSNRNTGAYCNYENDSKNVIINGRLYNWFAVSDIRNIAPTGWHVPTDAEWTTLELYLAMNGYGYGGSGDDIGKSMAATTGVSFSSNEGTIGNDPASNNSSGFTGYLSGARGISTGAFSNIGAISFWWSSDSYESTEDALVRYLSFQISVLYKYIYDKRYGFSVRCLKDK